MKREKDIKCGEGEKGEGRDIKCNDRRGERERWDACILTPDVRAPDSGVGCKLD